VPVHDRNLDSNKALKLGPERFRAPEILFNPELIGQEYAGVHQVVVDSIQRVDLDLRKSLFSNIVLSGGSTLCQGKTSFRFILIYSTPTL
jgi:centractin